MTKREITATAPDGTEVSITVGAKRVLGAIRITDFSRFHGGATTWMVSVHKTLENAITGPNQTPEWNSCARWAIAIDDSDAPAGGWFGASK